MLDFKENKRIEDAIKRVLPTATYYFDLEKIYWNILLKDQNGVTHWVNVNSVYLNDLDDDVLDACLKDIGYKICAKAAMASGLPGVSVNEPGKQD